jgi:hypothetical protein
MKKLLVSLFAITLSATSSKAQESSPHAIAAQVANLYALLDLATGPEPSMALHALDLINSLRTSAENDAGDGSARAYFDVLDLVDVPRLREIAKAHYENGEVLSLNDASRCKQMFLSRTKYNAGLDVWWTTRGGLIPDDVDWNTASDWFFIVAGSDPVLRTERWSDVLPDTEEGSPIPENLLEVSGTAFKKELSLTTTGKLLTKQIKQRTGGFRKALSGDEHILGLMRDVSNPDFGLNLFLFPDYSFCLLDATPDDVEIAK